MLIFNNIIKSVELLTLSSTEVSEATTGGFKPGIHRSIIIVDNNKQKWLVKLSPFEHISSWRAIPPNRCYVREVGAYIISNAMKMGLVPETRLINYDNNIGSAQKWVEAIPFEKIEDFPERDIWMSGIFDLLIAQTDRHRFNILRENDGFGGFHPVLIDNGYCLTGDTQVELLNDTFATMEELSKRTDDYWVYGMDEVGKIVPSLATPAKVTGENVPVYEVILDNGESVKATAEHLFLMRNNTYCSLKNLNVGNSLMPLYCKYSSKIVEIKFVGIVDSVYDITTTTHNFGLNAGIFVHNSMPFTIADRKKNIIISRFAYDIWNNIIPDWLMKMLDITSWDMVKRELYDDRLFGKNSAAVNLFTDRLNYILKNGKASIPNFTVTRRLIK